MVGYPNKAKFYTAPDDPEICASGDYNDVIMLFFDSAASTDFPSNSFCLLSFKTKGAALYKTPYYLTSCP